jgi:hypothetical protein
MKAYTEIYRYVYTKEGNISEIYFKRSPLGSETLIYAFEYDTHPNPMKKQPWYWREHSFFYAENENNVTRVQVYDLNGSQLLDDYSIDYEYDKATSYPTVGFLTPKKYPLASRKMTYEYQKCDNEDNS